jgi:uncharacterized membrane protein
MSYLRITPYIYLVAALFFFYEGVRRIQIGEQGNWIYFAIGALAAFMFFFRRNFVKKFEREKNDRKQ